MTIFLLIFGILLSGIAGLIKYNKTYLPKDPGCPTDVKDAENNMTHMKIFGITGPILLVTGIVLAILGIGLGF